MHDSATRRQFLRRALLLGAALPLSGPALRAREDETRPSRPRSPSEKLNLGIIGAGGRGAENLKEVSGENIIALCDVDAARLDEARQAFPRASAFTDYRKLLDEKSLDAVVISTPDHSHAIPAAAALRAGLDVYCEKPLAHSVAEARLLRELTAKHGRVTQLGTQIHAGDNYRRAVEIVKAGVIGPVRRVHVWQETRPRAGRRVKESVPPSRLDYDLWLGPAPWRPYHESHLHFHWRWWWDFGGGVLADMGCHYLDLPHWALDLHAPEWIAAEGRKETERDNEVPDVMRADYSYPARGSLPPVHLTWYHGGWKPEGAEDYKKSSAVLFEGEKGRLLADYGTRRIFVGDGSAVEPAPSIPSSIGHHREWIEAVKSRGKTTCPFEYGGELTEAVLLGNVAYRTGKKLEWDPKALRAPNAPEAAKYLQREYRKGWTL